MDLNELEKKIQLYVNEQCRYCRSSSSGVFGFFWVNATFNNISVISWRPVGRSVVFSIQHYVIKFVSDWRQVSGFLYATLCDKVCQ
jgi:hypothetical protein